jgi:hypothetical protein
MTVTKRKILLTSLGCLGAAFICWCAYVALSIYCARAFMGWDTVIENNMHDPEHREEIKQCFGLQFPESAEFEKSVFSRWLDADFHCVFTLPKKDIDLMFPPEKMVSYENVPFGHPPEKVTWHENVNAMLPQWSKKWLEGKNLSHFKVLKYHPTSGTRITVVAENPPDADENQRVWVYVSCFDD